MKAILVLAVFAAVASATSPACQSLLTMTMSPIWNDTIGHAIHSMTVQSLRMFKPDVTEKNGIPTVNQNLNLPNKVVPFAPDVPTGSAFTMFSMNEVDRLLSVLGTKDDGLGPHWQPVERVVHSLHMWDLWMTIKNNMVLVKDVDSSVCECLMEEISENGQIYQAVNWVAQHYTSATPISLLKRAHDIPHLTNAANWGIWKEDLLRYYTAEGVRDAAIFMTCFAKGF